MAVPLNQTMASDSIYLVNYDNGGSAMCLYTNKAWSINGEKPDQVILLSAPANITWEGQEITGNLWLPFRTNIAAGSIAQPAGTQVGTAQQTRASVLSLSPQANLPNARGYAIYNIFRDNDRVLYSDPALGNATSLYVCADSGQYAAEGAL